MTDENIAQSTVPVSQVNASCQNPDRSTCVDWSNCGFVPPTRSVLDLV